MKTIQLILFGACFFSLLFLSVTDFNAGQARGFAFLGLAFSLISIARVLTPKK